MKSLLPESDRILLGPGPSLTSPRVMRAMAAPTVGHLDPLMIAMLDDVRARLIRLFRATEDSFAFAVSGTGTSGMETAVANTVNEGTRVTVRLPLDCEAARPTDQSSNVAHPSFDRVVEAAEALIKKTA